MNGTLGPITGDELDAILDAPRPAPTRSVDAMLAGLDIDELLEIATEGDERGPPASLKGLLEGLRVKYGDDDATLAVLAAVEHYHLPRLLDGANG